MGFGRGFRLLRYEAVQQQVKHREASSRRQTACALGVSMLFCLVVAALWPVSIKVLEALHAPRSAIVSFSLGCGAVFGAWILHAAVVAFRKKLKLSDKAALQFTLFLLSLVKLQTLNYKFNT